MKLKHFVNNNNKKNNNIYPTAHCCWLKRRDCIFTFGPPFPECIFRNPFIFCEPLLINVQGLQRYWSLAQWSPAEAGHTSIPRGNLESSVILMWMSLNCGRKLYLAKTNSNIGQACKIHLEMLEARGAYTLLPWRPLLKWSTYIKNAKCGFIYIHAEYALYGVICITGWILLALTDVAPNGVSQGCTVWTVAAGRQPEANFQMIISHSRTVSGLNNLHLQKRWLT